MDFWEEIRFKKYTPKLFRGLVITAIVVAVIWGTVNRDSKKGVDLYLKEMEYISKPLVNYMENRMERFRKWGESLAQSLTQKN